uniref:tetratricopeptide repeat protein n=1 Tax=Rhodothermus marinus TaxID=29549 RepID=UPI000AB76344
RTDRRSAWRWVERGAFVVVALSVIYGGLFWWSRASQSELERLGFIAPAQLEVEQYRGEAAPGVSETERTYQEALREIRAAHRSFLGLFPHYDAERLARAESLLVATVRAAPEASPLRQEAQWLLGKVRLLRHDVDGARRVLQEVTAQEGPYTEAARELLTRLRCLETPELC